MAAFRHRSTDSFAAISAAVVLAVALAGAARAEAVPAVADAPCAIIEKFAGEAFILDASRTRVDELHEGGALPCDGWLSTADAWVQLRDRSGHVLRISRNSFVQLPAKDADLVVYRGVVHARAFGGGKSFSAWTPNGRAELASGAALLVYSPAKQSTEWVVLEQQGTLENRFEESSRITVREGESSILDLSRPRVVPQDPRAVTVASLKPVLRELAIDEKQMKRAVTLALERQRRVFPTVLSAGTDGGRSGRRPASVSHSDYRRHPAGADSEKALRRFRSREIDGSTGIGARSPAMAEAEELEQKLVRRARLDEERRRNELMKELGRIPAPQ